MVAMNRKLQTEEIERVSIEEFRSQSKVPLVVVLNDIRSMHNIGAMFRTADAFSLERLVLCGITAVPPQQEIHKSALGAEFSVEWSYSQSAEEAVEELNRQGYHTFALEQTERSIPLSALQLERGERYALVVGNEVYGVSQAAIDLCCGSIEIPQFGTKHSLNVSVAAGVAMWEFFKALK